MEAPPPYGQVYVVLSRKYCLGDPGCGASRQWEDAAPLGDTSPGLALSE